MDRKQYLDSLKPGDVVTRMLAGVMPIELVVQSVSDTIIDCGWTFHKETGAEIDEDLGWDGITTTGSYIKIPE